MFMHINSEASMLKCHQMLSFSHSSKISDEVLYLKYGLVCLSAVILELET